MTSVITRISVWEPTNLSSDCVETLPRNDLVWVDKASRKFEIRSTWLTLYFWWTWFTVHYKRYLEIPFLVNWIDSFNLIKSFTSFFIDTSKDSIGMVLETEPSNHHSIPRSMVRLTSAISINSPLQMIYHRMRCQDGIRTFKILTFDPLTPFLILHFHPLPVVFFHLKPEVQETPPLQNVYSLNLRDYRFLYQNIYTPISEYLLTLLPCAVT